LFEQVIIRGEVILKVSQQTEQSILSEYIYFIYMQSKCIFESIFFGLLRDIQKGD